MRLLSLSVDLDEIPCYAAIHALPAPQGAAAHAVYARALPRFEALFDELGARATFFAVGRDLEDASASQAIARLHRAGHEIGNHSFHHRYDLTRRPADVIRDDIADGSRAIERVTGVLAEGFRAPGYTVTDALLDQVRDLGFRYDSSVFPCPSYYGAKALVMGAMALRGRKSHSILDTPRVLTAPADPYRMGASYLQKGHGLLELPIGVTSRASGQLPFIGTSLAMASEAGARFLARRAVGRPLVNLELHGIDLCDAVTDGLEQLAPYQHDLRRPLEHKRRSLVAAVHVLLDAGYTMAPLREAARAFAQLA